MPACVKINLIETGDVCQANPDFSDNPQIFREGVSTSAPWDVTRTISSSLTPPQSGYKSRLDCKNHSLLDDVFVIGIHEGIFVDGKANSVANP